MVVQVLHQDAEVNRQAMEQAEDLGRRFTAKAQASAKDFSSDRAKDLNSQVVANARAIAFLRLDHHRVQVILNVLLVPGRS